MVVDASALICIFLREPERDQFLKLISATTEKSISAAGILEATMVLESRKGDVAGKELDRFVMDAGIRIVPVDLEQLELARAAFRKYGKGRHPAGLNFGDCFAYALAKATGEPLLAKGTDFGKTDIPLAV